MMDHSTALNKLLEAADLIGMLEDLTNSSGGKIGPSSVAGMRITLRGLRDSVLQSHDTLAQEVVGRAQAKMAQQNHAITSVSTTLAPQNIERSEISPAASSSDMNRVQFTKKDLRASLERIIEG